MYNNTHNSPVHAIVWGLLVFYRGPHNVSPVGCCAGFLLMQPSFLLAIWTSVEGGACSCVNTLPCIHKAASKPWLQTFMFSFWLKWTGYLLFGFAWLLSFKSLTCMGMLVHVPKCVCVSICGCVCVHVSVWKCLCVYLLSDLQHLLSKWTLWTVNSTMTQLAEQSEWIF